MPISGGPPSTRLTVKRVWDARHSYVSSDLVESMANAGVPVVSVGPTGFTLPIPVQQLLDGLPPWSGG